MADAADPDQGKRLAAGLMLAAALVLGAACSVLWVLANNKAASEGRVNAVEVALDGVSHDAVKPDHVPSLAAGGLRALLFLGGVILLAGAASPPPRSGYERVSDGTADA